MDDESRTLLTEALAAITGKLGDPKKGHFGCCGSKKSTEACRAIAIKLIDALEPKPVDAQRADADATQAGANELAELRNRLADEVRYLGGVMDPQTEFGHRESIQRIQARIEELERHG